MSRDPGKPALADASPLILLLAAIRRKTRDEKMRRYVRFIKLPPIFRIPLCFADG
jgi:hypothetical protein